MTIRIVAACHARRLKKIAVLQRANEAAGAAQGTPTYKPSRAVVFDFADSRGGQYTHNFLGLPGEDSWHGELVCDAFIGYKACFEIVVTEAGCLAQAPAAVPRTVDHSPEHGG